MKKTVTYIQTRLRLNFIFTKVMKANKGKNGLFCSIFEAKPLQKIPNTFRIQYLDYTRRHGRERKHHLKIWVGFILFFGGGEVKQTQGICR